MRNRVIPQTGVHNGPHVSFWIRELPFSPVLILTLLGVAHTSFLKLSIMGYWELLAPVIGLVCIGSGWSSANDKSARLQLICTQALYWAAFLLVTSIQRISMSARPGSPFSCYWRSALSPQVFMFFLGGSVFWDHHGALRSGGGMDRSFRSDDRVDVGSGARNWRCAWWHRHESRAQEA
jgi:hypothetical protein